MSRALKARRYGGAALACASLVACAPALVVQTAPEEVARPAQRSSVMPQETGNPLRDAAIVRHARLATAARESGDLATAADHEEVLVLLAPNDAAFRKALNATREAIRKSTRAHAEAGLAARRAGDLTGARNAFLHVLTLDPDNADAAKALREIELATMSKSQGDRAARVRSVGDLIANVKARNAEGYDLEQRLEILRAGDLNAGLRELRAWVDANPGERPTRQRIGTAIAEKAREIESKGQREVAIGLYEQANTLAGSQEWQPRVLALKKALGEHYYAEGMKHFRTDLAEAIRQWEIGARHDPSNTRLALRLRESKLAAQKLQKIEK